MEIETKEFVGKNLDSLLIERNKWLAQKYKKIIAMSMLYLPKTDDIVISIIYKPIDPLSPYRDPYLP